MAVGLQDHCHISAVLGGAPENAPDQYYISLQEDEMPNVIMNITRTLNGTLRRHILSESGLPVQFRDYHAMLKVYDYGGVDTRTRLANLRALNGKLVYYVPHYHVDDGDDHTSYVRTMVFQITAPVQWIDTGQTTAIIECSLTDADTVS